MRLQLRLVMTMFIVLLLAACGGGSGSNSDSRGTDNDSDTQNTDGTDSNSDDTDTDSQFNDSDSAQAPQLAALDDVLMGAGRSRLIALNATVEDDLAITYCLNTESNFATIVADTDGNSFLSLRPIPENAGVHNLTVQALISGDCDTPEVYDEVTVQVDVRLPALIKDISTTHDLDSAPRNVANINGTLYFAAVDNSGTLQMWKSDGTEDGTAVVKPAVDGGPTYPNHLTALGDDRVIFYANNALWVSDGTADGTHPLNPEGFNTQGRPSHFVSAGDKVFFSGDTYEDGTEIWVTDGTDAGTHVTRAITEGFQGGAPAEPRLVINGELYFVYKYFTGSPGAELWKSDGTEEGTLLVTNSDGTQPCVPDYLEGLRAMDGVIYMRGTTADEGSELWAYDPALEDGFYLVRDINVGVSAGTTALLGATSSQLFTVSRHQLWTTNGTEAGTKQVKNFGSPGISVDDYAVAGERMFIELSESTYGYQLWVTDGTESGTVLTKELETGSSGYIFDLTAMGNNVVFVRVMDDGTTELWFSDGTESGTHLVKDIYPGKDAKPEKLVEMGGLVYFTANDGLHGRELWVTDGSEEGTYMLKNLRTTNLSSQPHHLQAIGEQMFFAASDDNGDNELWVSNGTTDGTMRLKDINAGGSGYPQELTRLGDKILFSATDGIVGQELWITDGTVEGTMLLKDINPADEAGSNPKTLVTIQDNVYFTADDGTHGQELWISDGTAEGTEMLLDINPDGDSAVGDWTHSPVALDDNLFFRADDGTNGRELWKSDGTPAGTAMLKDINESDNSNPGDLLVVGDTLFFRAETDNHRTSLWKTDGTEDGTVLVSDGSYPYSIVSWNDQVFFISGGSDFRNLWVTDGTELGTTKLMTLKDDQYYFGKLQVIDDGVVFMKATEELPNEYWKTDGTVDGTVQLTDLNADDWYVFSTMGNVFEPTDAGILYFQSNNGAISGLAQTDGTERGSFVFPVPDSLYSMKLGPAFATTDNFLYFSINDSVHGTELWVLPR